MLRRGAARPELRARSPRKLEAAGAAPNDSPPPSRTIRSLLSVATGAGQPSDAHGTPDMRQKARTGYARRAPGRNEAVQGGTNRLPPASPGSFCAPPWGTSVADRTGPGFRPTIPTTDRPAPASADPGRPSSAAPDRPARPARWGSGHQGHGQGHQGHQGQGAQLGERPAAPPRRAADPAGGPCRRTHPSTPHTTASSPSPSTASAPRRIPGTDPNQRPAPEPRPNPASTLDHRSNPQPSTGLTSHDKHRLSHIPPPTVATLDQRSSPRGRRPGDARRGDADQVTPTAHPLFFSEESPAPGA